MCGLTIERLRYNFVFKKQNDYFEFRFIGIVYPLRSKFLREQKHVILITIIVWIFSLLCASPNLIYLHVLINPNSSRRSCSLEYLGENPVKNQYGYIIHKSIESMIFYFLPLLLQIYCYARIARRLYHVDETLRTSFHTIGKLTLQRTQVYLIY
jgi:thyrotropin-releasing hormone receptor